MQDIIIYGCGGFGREVLQVLRAINAAQPSWNCVGFLVDAGFETKTTVHGLPVASQPKALNCTSQTAVVVGIGNPHARKTAVDRLIKLGLTDFPTLIHPRSWIGDFVELGEGTIVCAGALLTTDIRIGAHVHLNIGSTVGHDTRIGDFSTISPGVNISGKVTLGQRVEIGSAASVIPGVDIGDDVTIGAGAAVVKSIPAGCTAVGVPAKVIRQPSGGS